MKLQKTEILVLRDVKHDMTSHEGFAWPKLGKVEAKDWKPTFKCGNGLHGLPWGCGGSNYSIGGTSGKWLVVKVETTKDNYCYGKGELVDKCKFHKGEVVFCGTREKAVELIQAYAPANLPVNWATQKAGDNATQIANDYSTQTASYSATQKAGHYSTQIANDYSTQTAGYYATQKAGHYSAQTAGDYSTQIANYSAAQKAGYSATQKAGDYATQTADDNSTQTADYSATQTAGDNATQKAGLYSTQKAGLNSVQIQYWYDSNNKYHVATRIVTQKETNKTYMCNKGKWEEIKK